MKSASQFQVIISLSALTFAALAPELRAKPREPIALVYEGPGACEEDCSAAAAEIARLEGLTPLFVGPQDIPQPSWSNAAAWIQPGGKSSTVARSMSAELKTWIREFTHKGGAYVGFCAGGFYSTAEVSDRGIAGLGVMPGLTRFFDSFGDTEVIITEILWAGVSRQVYWEGGPYFVLPETPVGESPRAWPLATYANGQIAAAQALFGEGRVSVSGPHPEAPESWKTFYKLQDSDGPDTDLAQGMLRWALALPPRD